MGFVDVNDVAMAHYLAGESSKSNGQRYYCVSEGSNWLEVCKYIKEILPSFQLSSQYTTESVTPAAQDGIQFFVDNSKIQKDLGLNFKIPSSIYNGNRRFLD